MTKKRERSPLEVALGFRIEIRKAEELGHRSGSLIWTKDDGTTKAVRPCTIAEIQMWEHLNAFYGEAAQGIADAHKSLDPFGPPKEEA